MLVRRELEKELWRKRNPFCPEFPQWGVNVIVVLWVTRAFCFAGEVQLGNIYKEKEVSKGFVKKKKKKERKKEKEEEEKKNSFRVVCTPIQFLGSVVRGVQMTQGGGRPETTALPTDCWLHALLFSSPPPPENLLELGWRGLDADVRPCDKKKGKRQKQKKKKKKKKSFAKKFVISFQFIEDMAEYMTGFIICVAVGVLLIVVMVFTGLILCCCRCCCGNCGGQVDPQEGRNSKRIRLGCGLLIFVFNTILL